MEGEQNDMKEIKVMVFAGNIAELAKSSMRDTMLKTVSRNNRALPYSNSPMAVRENVMR